MGTDVEKAVVVTAETENQRKKEACDFTDVVGGDGTWQRRILALFILMAMPCAWHNLSMAFLAPNVEFNCDVPSEVNASDTRFERAADQCHVYKYVNSSSLSSQTETVNGTIEMMDATEQEMVRLPCHKWTFNDSLYESTVVSQWNLVCDKAWMVSLTNSVLMFGFLTSVFVLGQVADKIGRRPVIVGSSVILLVSGLVSAFSMSFMMFTISRFFIAFGAAGVFNTGFTLLMEIVGAESRSVYGIVCEFGWSAGYVMLPGIAWFIRDWFWLQLALTLPCVGLLASWWLIPESPRWLITQGKPEKAERILLKMAQSNKKNVQDISASLKKIWPKSDQAAEKQKASIIDLFRRGLWQKTLNLYFCWFVNSFIYYGLTFNTNDLSGNAFLNFAIAGAVEFPAYACTVFVIKTMGRRIPLMATMVIAGLACLLTVPLNGDLSWMRVPLCMFGKFCITASFGIAYVFTAEIFPTIVRNTGVGTSSMCARIGSILAPFVKELGIATHPAVPLACYGIMSIVSGVLIMILPETNGCKVPDTFEEAASFGRTKPKKMTNHQAPEDEETQKSCVVHDGTAEKPKPPPPTQETKTPPITTTAPAVITNNKPVSDGKKLPDLLEEPSVIDEAADENDREENQQPHDEPPMLIQQESIETTAAPTVTIQVPELLEPAAAAAPVVVEPTQTESMELQETTPILLSIESNLQQQNDTPGPETIDTSSTQLDGNETPQQTPL